MTKFNGINNPFLDMSVSGLTLAYLSFNHLDDDEAVVWVAEAFCLLVELEFELTIRPSHGEGYLCE